MGELVTIGHPDTLSRWIRESKKVTKRNPAKKGRPRTKEEIRELIIKLARENEWGYTRIMGALKKLGIKPPSRNTVKNIRPHQAKENVPLAPAKPSKPLRVARDIGCFRPYVEIGVLRTRTLSCLCRA